MNIKSRKPIPCATIMNSQDPDFPWIAVEFSHRESLRGLIEQLTELEQERVDHVHLQANDEHGNLIQEVTFHYPCADRAMWPHYRRAGNIS